MKLGQNVELAEGVTIPEAAWYLHGQVLLGGIARHRVIIRGFPIDANGSLGIKFTICPLDVQLPLRFKEA